MKWRDSMSGTPRKADYAWAVLARVLSFGEDRAKLDTNVCERGGSSTWPRDRRKYGPLITSPNSCLLLPRSFKWLSFSLSGTANAKETSFGSSGGRSLTVGSVSFKRRVRSP